MKRFEMPAAAGMILLSCRRIVEQGCGAQLLVPGRFSWKRKAFSQRMTGGYVSIITLQVDWQESSDQVLLIHIESIYAYAYVYMQNIF